MFKKYIVKVNGKSYEVEVEEVDMVQKERVVETKANPAKYSANSKPVQVSNQSNQQEKQPSDVENSDAGTTGNSGEKINAPMSGTIVKIKARVGEIVKDGQTLLTLEAMKMENEILAPRDCKIKEIFVKEGQQVEIDQILITIE